MSEVIRTRIAPSPTGAPHIGTAYIALHNLALARANGGQFLLRIEDTDRVRSSKKHEDEILKALHWLGLEWDEGPDTGGEYGPYRQSERLEIYSDHARQLIEKGKAYRCFCTKERLDAVRTEQMKNKQNPGYDGHCRELDKNEAEERATGGEPHVVRLKVPRDGETTFFDEIRGETIRFENAGIDDQVLLKVDGFPTYHLANVVDDHLMKITHVMRGEEWISSAPKHILLYEAFGWQAPKLMHLPLLRNEDKSKISKRKNPTSLHWFMAKGYTRDAIVNFLALMGYSMEDGKEFFNREELFKDYDFRRISTTAPVFDFVKLDRINSKWLSTRDPDTFTGQMLDASKARLAYLRPLLPHLQVRTKQLGDIERWSAFLFERENRYEPDAFIIKNLEKAPAEKLLRTLAKAYKKNPPSTMDEFKQSIAESAEEQGVEAGPAMMLCRVAVTGEQESLPLYEVMEFLGGDQIQKKMRDAADFVKSNWPESKKKR